MRYLLTWTALIVGLPLYATSQELATDYGSTAAIRQFAESLFERGEYLRAASEYERHMFLSRTESGPILLRIARCYQLADVPDRTVGLFQQLVRTADSPGLADTLRYEIGRSYFLMGRYEASLRYIDSALQQTAEVDQRRDLRHLQGLNYLQLRHWSEAATLYQSLAQGLDSRRARAQALADKAIEAQQLPVYNPHLAGMFSALIPGTGKMQVGLFHDGLFSLLTVGFTGWLAYDGFRERGKESVQGWVFAPAAVVFHLGNVYGTMRAARLRNRDRVEDFLATIEFRDADR
ncbi:MAG: hypothetical protein HOH74_32180 [Gemmatimonadetes bacterium]|mgnify:CR=1 FL=1|jgi:tetratricopeptide (TPR) repeat protein|nr:hypothetical protein [Gemmatimonadota bacterium]